jgi:inorganic pyrophosphatase/exopolyphosphatase
MKEKQPELTKENFNKNRPEYLYFESIGKYVALKPLKVDDRVVKVANQMEISLNWDDEGRVTDIDFIESKKLVEGLGGSLLSPDEYWKIYKEAILNNDLETIDDLSSDQFTEWLDVIYQKDEKGNVVSTNHPKLIFNNDGFEFTGETQVIKIPEGRPAWFDPKDNIVSETGMPKELKLHKEVGDNTWKYWSVFKIKEPVAAIRGYVTSSGTASFDCDIPLGAKQPVLMIRECRTELVSSIENKELILESKILLDSYEKTVSNVPAVNNSLEHESLYNQSHLLISFIRKFGKELIESKDKETIRIKERIIDILGIVRLLAKEKADTELFATLNSLAKEVFMTEGKEAGIESLTTFVLNSKDKLKEGLESKSKIVFVMGHKNPDTDAIVSSLFEAYRNSFLSEEIIYVPVVQADKLPDEIRLLLGDEISDNLLYSNDPLYISALNSGLARWILTDQNVSEVQKFTVSIVDHHVLSDKAEKQDVMKTWDMVGSTSCLIMQKMSGIGLSPDKDLARILYGATLMDTENRVEHKMCYKDSVVMNYLKDISKVESDDELFQRLMSALLNTDDSDQLFNRDYKQDWGIFGFAVSKVKGVFDNDGNILKQDLLDDLVKHAEENNSNKNFPLTIVKLVNYEEDNETVQRERLFLVFNQHTDDKFKNVMFELIEKILRVTFKDKEFNISKGENHIDFWGTGGQLSRKVTAPYMEKIVDSFNKFYFSKKSSLYIKRSFLEMTDEVKSVAEKLNIEISKDKNDRINNIRYPEARLLLDGLGMKAMSLPEYWIALNDAKENNDVQMIEHLQSPGFVEFLDSVILDGKYVIHHPKIILENGEFRYEGERTAINIPEGIPGLIDPDDIDYNTGFPKVIKDPADYKNKKLWRYWSPDAKVCIPTRGHIFLLNQPSFDNKIHPEEALVNLGIRPVTDIVKYPTIDITEENGDLKITINDRD